MSARVSTPTSGAQVIPLANGPAPQASTPLQAATALSPTTSTPAAVQGPGPLSGGTLDPVTGLKEMNCRFFVSERDSEVGVYRIEDDGSITHLARDHFQLLVANVFVESGGKLVPIDKFWLKHQHRRTCRKIVFEPNGKIAADEYNLWRGFAVVPKKGNRKQRRLLRHIWRIICKRDKIKFKYLMKWLAWAVQNPDRHAEVAIVLMSGAEGSGKSTLGQVLLDIFGRTHGLLVDDKQQLLGQFNSHLETTCFALCEEVLWAGDPRIADALKPRISASTIPIDEKYRHRRQVPNRLHIMFTTNHAWAISAGVQARRFFVVEVSDEVAQHKGWFEPLYRDLADGGTAEFLNLLLSLKLGSWHPREVPKTAELIEQQVLSAGSVEEWLLACVETDSIIGKDAYPAKQLATEHSTQALYESYREYTRQRSARVQPLVAFGRVLTKILGPSRRLPATTSSSNRPPGYFVPDAAALDRAVHHHLKTGK
jgi:hypothetical protein